jgi:rubrerythrin
MTIARMLTLTAATVSMPMMSIACTPQPQPEITESAPAEITLEEALAIAIDDERHARAFYEAVLAKHGQRRPFSKIVQAERRHEAMLLAQYQRLGLTPPPDTWVDKTIKVPDTFAHACDASVVAEVRNVAIYDRIMDKIDDDQVRATFERLRWASQERHLPAFQRFGSGWKPVIKETLTPTQQKQLQKAEQAKKDMFGKLLSTLSTTLAEQGTIAAIDVCSEVAPKVANSIAADYGLKIGRTSWKLRNPSNRPPVWAALLVDEKVAQQRLMADRNGRLGVLSPIRINAACIQCHGPKDQIDPQVRQQLDHFYPEDQATGFNDGDLRGWFWVEVPPNTAEETPKPDPGE